ncbi:hypothetical protein Q8F55_008934 [Vanrija albida]|uniref:Uncharacterized protein n=1 Tax=Vanrija albida TaxID=181172 RepID=A0ABR3PT46_9TREE
MGKRDNIELRPLGAAAASGSTTSLPPPYPDHPAPSPSLTQGYRAAEDAAKARVRPGEGAMDAASVYGLFAAGWFALCALPLLTMPRLVLFLAGPSAAPSPLNPSALQAPLSNNPASSGPIPSYDRGHYDALTHLEAFSLRLLGLGLVALALVSLFVVVPSYAPGVAPGRQSTIVVWAILGSIAAVVSWNAPLGALATITSLGNAVLSGWGWWAVFFGNDDRKFKKYLKPNSRLKRL